MTFEQFLKSQRKKGARIPLANPGYPYADTLEQELSKHLKTVQDWIDPNVDVGRLRDKMAEAMDFFSTRYTAGGITIYRGTEKLIFDGRPASYSKSENMAQVFAIMEVEDNWFFRKRFYVVKRKAPAKSLDLGKLLSDYATGKWSNEQEVIVFNTPVGEKNITEYDLDRDFEEA